MSSSFALEAQNSKIYEAEFSVSDSTLQISDSSSSNSKYLLLEHGGFIKWTITPKQEGWYNLIIRYRAKDSDKAQFLTVNNKTRGIGFSMCNNWEDASFTTYLNKAENQVCISADWGNIDIDYIKLPEAPVYLLPTLSPSKSVFYKNNPVQLSILIDAKDRKLNSINCGAQKIDFTILNYEYIDGAYYATLSTESLKKISTGSHQISLLFNDGEVCKYNIEVKNDIPNSGLTIVMFDVEHGNSVLFKLPNGKLLLVDSGKEKYAKTVVIPFMENNKIQKIDYFILTHYHDDHMGAKDSIIKKFHIENVYDYKSFKTGDSIIIGEVKFNILNSFADGTEENDRSMSFILSWNGFKYSHGSDNYAVTQERIIKKYSSLLPSEVFYANHHFHGSVNPAFIIRTNPSLVVVSAEQSVYARGAYTNTYKEKTEKNLYQMHANLSETLLTLEVGSVVVRVNNSNNWSYETYRNFKDIYFPNF